MKIYGKVGESTEYVNPKNINGLTKMKTNRPTAESVATAEGDWITKPYLVEDLYSDTMAFLDTQTNAYEIGAFKEATDNELAQENIEWFNGVWASYYGKKAQLPAKYEINYENKPHSYAEVFLTTESEQG